jgi:hypothetical protein
VEVVRRSAGAMKRTLSPENLLAVALCLIAILLLIATSDSAPQWIYQGF